MELEGSLSSTYGYCLFVKEDNTKAFLDEGVVDDYGNAVFKVNYHAIYFNLFVGEVVDGVVSIVSEVKSLYEHSLWIYPYARKESDFMLAQSLPSLIP